MPIKISSFDCIWQATGTSPAAWTTAGNWAGGVPLSGEHILVPAGTAPIDCTSMTSNIAYGSFVQERGYNYTIGTSGVPLTGAFAQLVLYGGGKVWFEGTNGAGSDSTPLITVAAGRGATDILNVDGSDVGTIKALRGIVTLSQTMGAMTRLEMGGITSNDVTVNALTNSNAIAAVWLRSGRLLSDRLISLLYQDGGDAVQQVNQAITEANITAGNLNYQSEATMATARIGENGTLDAQTGRSGTVTITTLDIGHGGRFIDDPRVTVTNRRDDIIPAAA